MYTGGERSHEVPGALHRHGTYILIDICRINAANMNHCILILIKQPDIPLELEAFATTKYRKSIAINMEGKIDVHHHYLPEDIVAGRF